MGVVLLWGSVVLGEGSWGFRSCPCTSFLGSGFRERISSRSSWVIVLLRRPGLSSGARELLAYVDVGLLRCPVREGSERDFRSLSSHIFTVLKPFVREGGLQAVNDSLLVRGLFQ